METTTSNAAVHAGKYLSFQLGGEIYGLEILKVQEIIGVMNVTRIPRTPDFIRGVINLRGKVIPVIDLRVKFQLPPQVDTDRTCIIVVQFHNLTGTKTMGILVDEVSEVINIGGEQIEDTPSFGTDINTDFILGVGKVNQKVVMLLHVEKVLSVGEVLLIDQAAQES